MTTFKLQEETTPEAAEATPEEEKTEETTDAPAEEEKTEESPSSE